LPTRAWQLAIGGLVALTVVRWRRLSPRAAAITGWTGLAMIVLACVWFHADTPFPGTAALLPTLGATLVIGAGCAQPTLGCGRILGLAPMRAIGRISYSWYLWHWPVLILAPALFGHPLGLPARITAAILSAALAWLTLRYLENPLRFTPKIRDSAWRSLGLGAIATALAVVVGVALLAKLPAPIGHGPAAPSLHFTATTPPPGADIGAYDTAVQQAIAQVQAAITASADLTAVPANLQPPLTEVEAERNSFAFNGCLRTPFQSGQPECAMGDTASSNTMALIGDSHAAMMVPAFQQIAEQRHWRLELMAKGACPVIESPVSSILRYLVEGVDHCEQWRGQILDRLRAEHPRLVVISMWRGYGIYESLSGLRSYSPAWLDGMTSLVRDLRSTGAKVLVLGPIPDPHFVVPLCLSGNLDDVMACTPTRSEAVNPPGIAAEATAAKAGGGQYADLTDLFCTKDHCPVIVGNTLAYLDETHTTLEYSRALAPAIGAITDRAFAHN
jgi:hypothetical protein